MGQFKGEGARWVRLGILLFVYLWAVVLHSHAQVDNTNPNCAAGNVWTGPTSDGPAAYPTTCMYTAMASTPSPNSPKYVGPTDDLQTALTGAVCGDLIKVDPANVSTVTTFPSLSCDAQHWVNVQTSALSMLPNEFTRISPAFTPYMPKIVTATNAVTGGAWIRITGFRMTRRIGTHFQGSIVAPGATGFNFILDRDYIYGSETDETHTGVVLANASNVAVINSYFERFICISGVGACTEAQAISCADNTIPMSNFKVVNNHLESAGEEMYCGGGASQSTPTDFTIAYNTMFLPQRYDPNSSVYQPVIVSGKPHGQTVKNLLEVKNNERAWIQGNWMMFVWGGYTQTGSAVLFTPKNQAAGSSSVCPLCEDVDMILKYNRTDFSGVGTAAGYVVSDNGGWPRDAQRWSITHNLFVKIQYPNCFACGRNLASASSGYSSTNPPPATLKHILYDHDAWIDDYGFLPPPPTDTTWFIINGPPANNPTNTPQIIDFNVTNSIAASGSNGFVGGGGGNNSCTTNQPDPVSMWGACFLNSTFTNNGIMNGDMKRANNWPGTNVFIQSWALALFNPDYSLSVDSPFHAQATDGSNLGPNVAVLNAELAKATVDYPSWPMSGSMHVTGAFR